VYVANESNVDVWFDEVSITYKQQVIAQENHYDPWGLNLVGLEKNGSPNHKYQYNGKEKVEDFGLNWNDYGARQYDIQLGKWHCVDTQADTYSGNSPYVYALNNPINAIDPDGNLVIFINGNHFGSGGTPKYWRGYHTKSTYHYSPILGGHHARHTYEYPDNLAFDKQVMKHFNDYDAMYIDGSLGGFSPLRGIDRQLTSFERSRAGYQRGLLDAQGIIEKITDENGTITETIKIITHSMGGAYGKGYVRALVEYIKKHNLQGQAIIEIIGDFAPYQSDELEARNDEPQIVGPTVQFSDRSDWLAGTKDEKGIPFNHKKNSGKDFPASHHINNWLKDIAKLAPGQYEYKNGQWVPIDDSKNKK
jgi:RHS repeat-associated protein